MRDETTLDVTAREYAGFWRRVGAALIDALILSLVEAPLAPGRSESPLAVPLSLLISWLYFALMQSSSVQATVGKMALRIVVTDIDGRRISFARATGRYFAKFLSVLTLGIGFLMAAFTARKQALHDIVADTLVVRRA